MQPSLAALRGVLQAMLITTSIVFACRTAARMRGTFRIVAADFILLAAFICFLGLDILYLATIGPIYRWQSATAGETEMYAGYVDDLVVMRKVMLINSYMLWCVLWLVKLAFLALYWKLVQGMPTFLRMWWGVLIFVVLAFVGNIPAHLVSCRKLDFFEPAGCQSREDQIGQLTSLYYSFVADVATDLAVMFLPLIVVRKLQVNRGKKIGIIFLFSVGWICIGIAIIRVIKLGEGQGQFIPGWLAMWGSVEGAVAVIVGCGPGLYISAKEAYRSRTAASYGSGLSHGEGRVYSGAKWSGKTWTKVGDRVRNERGAIEVESRFELRETRRTPSAGDEQLLRQAGWPKEAISEIRNASQTSEHSKISDDARSLRS